MTSRLAATAARLGPVLRYLALGGLAAGVNWGSRFAWGVVLPFWAAVIAAYATGMVVAFLLFRTFVFPGSIRPLHEQVRNFVLVNLLGLAQTWALSLLLVHWLLPRIGWTFQPEAAAHAAAIVAPTLTSWFGHRYLTFGAARSAHLSRQT